MTRMIAALGCSDVGTIVVSCTRSDANATVVSSDGSKLGSNVIGAENP